MFVPRGRSPADPVGPQLGPQHVHDVVEGTATGHEVALPGIARTVLDDDQHIPQLRLAPEPLGEGLDALHPFVDLVAKGITLPSVWTMVASMP